MTDRISALKTLLTRLVDSREGYRDAIDHAESADVKSVLRDFMSRRDRDASEVRAFLNSAGEQVDEDGSMLASAHRVFLDLKDRVTGSDDKAVLEEVVRGEKKLLDAYDDALKAENATDPEYGFLRDQRASLDQAITELKARSNMAA